MTIMQINDRIDLSDTKLTPEGFLVATASIARTGLHDYLAFEVGIKDGDLDRVVKVFRPPDEVFAQDALDSFKRKPVTDGHPFEPVNAKNAKDHTLGVTGDEVTQDGDLVRTTITLLDASVVVDVQRGRKHLSAGYSTDIDLTPGVTPDGQAYDAIQRNIRGNHVALVDVGRCGDECRIGDESSVCDCGTSCSCGGRKVTDKLTLTTTIVDGIPVETTPNAVTVIDKLSKDLDEARKALADANTAHATAIADKDKELGTKDAEITKLNDAAVKPDQIDQMVADRAKVVDAARTIAADLDVTGKSDGDVRRSAVAAKIGDAAVAGKSDDYVEAIFDGLVLGDKQSGSGDPVIQSLSNPVTTQTQDKGKADAYNGYVQSLQDAWKGDAAKGGTA